jgi:hypothetical protein
VSTGTSGFIVEVLSNEHDRDRLEVEVDILRHPQERRDWPLSTSVLVKMSRSPSPESPQ